MTTFSEEEETDSQKPVNKNKQFKELNTLVYNAKQLMKISKVNEIIGYQLSSSIKRLANFVQNQQANLQSMIEGLRKGQPAILEIYVRDIVSIFKNLNDLSKIGEDERMAEQSDQLIHDTLL